MESRTGREYYVKANNKALKESLLLEVRWYLPIWDLTDDRSDFYFKKLKEKR